MHPFRKEKHCLLTELSKYARLVRLSMPEKKSQEVSDMQIELAAIKARRGCLKHTPGTSTFCMRVHLKPAAVSSVGIPSVACTCALQ